MSSRNILKYSKTTFDDPNAKNWHRRQTGLPSERTALLIFGKKMSAMATSSLRRACLTTLMCPSSANLMGNVHGGTILRLCEEAGRIAGTKWSRGPVALVGASKTQFRRPIHVGEVATVDASVDYVGRHAIRVGMTVQAENMETGHKRLTNTASMWYSTVDIDSDSHTMTVGSRKLHPLHPAQVAPDAAEEHAYFASARAKIPLDSREEEEFPVVLADLPGSDAIANHVFVSAGYILKLMDSGAALAAVSFARTSCVTVLLDKVCFHTPITVGDLCTVRAGVTYTSSRSLEVVAQVWKSNSGIVGGLCKDEDTAPVCAVEGRFVFVSLGSDGKVLEVPELPEESRTKRWEVGAAKHAERRFEQQRKVHV